MSQRAGEIARRIEDARDEVVSFVEGLNDKDWKRTCKWEEWPVGATAYHLGDGHFGMTGLLQMIVKGEPLPQLTFDQINEQSDRQTRKHLDCTREEALEKLRTNGDELVSFVSGLTDEELDRKGNMPAFGGEITAARAIDLVIFQSAHQHLGSMKAAVDR